MDEKQYSNGDDHITRVNGHTVKRSGDPTPPESVFPKHEIGEMSELEQSTEWNPRTLPVPIPVKQANDENIAEDATASFCPPELEEPGIIILYKTRKSEAVSVQKEVIKDLMWEIIDQVVLPVGTVGTPYECAIDFSSKDLTDNFGGIEIVGANISTKMKSLGLSCCKTEGKQTEIKIIGTPTTDFDEKLYFLIIHPDFKKDAPKNVVGEEGTRISFTQYPKEYVHSKSLLLNPDPRSLWNNLPVEDYEGYENADDVSNGTVIPGLTLEVIAASKRGRSHEHVGKPRDDCYYMEFDASTGWNYVVVADGAGSAKFSRKGSELACQTIVKTLRASLSPEVTEAIFSKEQMASGRWRNEFLKNRGQMDPMLENEFVEETQLDKIFRNAVYYAHKAIESEATERQAALKDYHTTLLCAAFRFIKELNTFFIVSYWVGDGGAALFADNSSADSPWNDVLVLGEPDGGEFAGQTRFLTMPSELFPEAVRKRLRFSFCDKIEAMLLVTDGITDPFFPSESAVCNRELWKEFYEQKLKHGCVEEPNGCPILDDSVTSPQEKAVALLKWLEFWSKGNHDDRTVLIVKPR